MIVVCTRVGPPLPVIIPKNSKTVAKLQPKDACSNIELIQAMMQLAKLLNYYYKFNINYINYVVLLK